MVAAVEPGEGDRLQGYEDPAAADSAELAPQMVASMEAVRGDKCSHVCVINSPIWAINAQRVKKISALLFSSPKKPAPRVFPDLRRSNRQQKPQIEAKSLFFCGEDTVASCADKILATH
jgi:hypothetical protein